MAKKRSSLTFTVFAGYFLLAALAALAVWFSYGRVNTYISMAERNNNGNQKLLLVGEAATKLYEAESLSRQMIQNPDSLELSLYTSKIDSIKSTLASLQNFRTDSGLDKEIDSINLLLSQKSRNLQELLEIRRRGATESFYSRVLRELRKVDETFEEPNYAQRFKDLEPHQRRVLVKLLNFAEMENPQTSNITVDSIVTSVKTVLRDLEMEERQYLRALRTQENQLLQNEIEINNRLRTLLSTIEAEERRSSMQQVSNWQETIEGTSKKIAFLAAASLLVILLFVFLVVRDISRSQQYRRQLENAKSYAESLLKSREQFMNTVTHDLRSPLNSVVGYSSLLEKTGLNSSQNRYLQQLKKSSDYILHLVNDLLDFSKLEAGKMSVEELPFNPKSLIEESVENAIPAEKSEKVEIIVDVSEELDQKFITDPFRLKQILMNLVSNAFKFTSEGKVEVIAGLKEAKEKPFLEIVIRDTGIGISEDQKEHVFEEFSQENSSIEKRFGGSGLGLAISKKLTDLLHGNISLESEPGVGTTFYLEIPVKKSEKRSISEEKSTPEIPFSRFDVVIADDEPSQLELLKELLKSKGISCRTAKNGKEAIHLIREKNPDLVLTDIQMPEMTGTELLQELQREEKTAETPVVALSGQANVSPAEYLKMGFSGSLLKPYSSEKLLRLIEEILKVKLQRQPVLAIKKKINGSYTLAEIKRFSGEDSQALENIINSFISSSRENLAEMQLASQENDCEKVSALAHKMLPLFRQLQTEKIIKKLEILEKGDSEAVKNVDLKQLSEEIEVLLQDLRQEITV